MNEEGVATRVFKLKDGEGNARWWGGGLATIKATGKETGGLYSIVEVLEPQGAQAPLHLHRKEDEAFWVLEGEMTFHIGEETIKARPGSFVFGPKDVPHTYTVDSGPAKLLFLLSPPGFEGFVEAISRPAKALTLPPSESEVPPDEEDTTDGAASESFAVLEARYGCEIVDSTPQGPQPSEGQGKEQPMNEDVTSRTYGLREGEGEARWWMGGLATVKARQGDRRALHARRGARTRGRATVPRPPSRRRRLLGPRGRTDVRGRRGDDKGHSRVVPLRSQGRPSPLHRGVGAGEATVRPLASGLRGVHLRHERAGEGAHPAAPAGRRAQ